MDNNDAQQQRVIETTLGILRLYELKPLARTMNSNFGQRIKASARKSILCQEIANALLRSAGTHLQEGLLRETNNYLAHSGYRLLVQDGIIRNGRGRPAIAATATTVTAQPPAPSRQHSNAHTSQQLTVSFMPSPFYTPVARLAGPTICEAALLSRGSQRLVFTLTTDQQALLLSQGEEYQLRFFCAAYPGEQGTPLLLEFPQPCELSINNQHLIKSQFLRGVKNTPGTVHAMDITPWCHSRTMNCTEIVYANNTKRYVATVELVKRLTVDTLVQRMVSDRTVHKDQILQKFRQQQADDDIVMESESLSLRCPLSFARISLPCRSQNCRHAQCYDATTFLAMNEQTPTWTCPVCDRKIASVDELIIDGFFQDLLTHSDDTIETVTIDSNGNLQRAVKREPSPEYGNSMPAAGSESPIDISDAQETPPQPAPPTSSTPSFPTVIDLTASDDES